MIISGDDVPTDTTIEADICIVGTGPAAMTLANELQSAKVGVVMLESGNIVPDLDAQVLNEGIRGIDPAYSPFELRRRQLGGTANSWGLKLGPELSLWRAAPLDETDFERRDGLPFSGWPFGRTELEPYYHRAHHLCGLGPFDYRASTWERPGSPQLVFPGGRLVTTMFQLGRKEVFTEDCKEKVKVSASFRCYYHATAVELETDDLAHTVERARVISRNGKRFWVSARVFVLAGGTIENTRLLLLSNRVSPAGLGNSNDLVGRFFMDHFVIHCGYLIPPERAIFDRVDLYDIRVVDGTIVQGKLAFASEVLRKERMINSITYLLPRGKTHHFKFWAIDSYRAMKKAIKRGRLPPDTIGHLKNLGRGGYHLASAVYRRLMRKKAPFALLSEGSWAHVPNKSREFATFEIQHMIEQFPDPDNRLTLSEERDKLGCRKVKSDNKLREHDLNSLRRLQSLLQAEFAEAGMGRLVITPEPFPSITISNGAAHHMGTTRMHADPKRGVVDQNCKVHGVANLYISSGSVFPTGGYANPSLTIIALAIRLGDHLKRAGHA